MEENEQLQHNMLAISWSSLTVSCLMNGSPQILPARDKQIQGVVVNSHDNGHDEVPARGRPVPGIQQPEEQANHMPWVPTSLYQEIISINNQKGTILSCEIIMVNNEMD
jgi:hypothetical protein